MVHQVLFDNNKEIHFDLTALIVKAIDSNLNWRERAFFNLIDFLTQKDFRVLYWEEDENWATIQDGQTENIVGYVWRLHPLVIVLESLKDCLLELTNQDDLICILVQSLTEKRFVLSIEVLKDYFENNMDFNSFSIEDLWQYSNSR